MKRLVSLVVVILAVSLGLGLTAHHLQRVEGVVGSGNNVLNLYNWGDYIDPALITKFEHETGYHVSYQTFDSNESMYTKLMSGEKYDVIVPSDYMVQRLIEENQLQKLDKSVVSLDNVLPNVLNQSFDPNNEYSAPYFWGNVGLIYDTTQVDVNDLNEGWNVLLNPKYKEASSVFAKPLTLISSTTSFGVQLTTIII